MINKQYPRKYLYGQYLKVSMAGANVNVFGLLHINHIADFPDHFTY